MGTRWARDGSSTARGGPRHELCGGLCGLAVDVLEDARVDVAGDLDARVPEQLGHDLEVARRAVGQRRRRVPEVMQPDRWQLRVPDQPVEAVTDTVRVERRAVLTREDPSAVCPRLA